jgi:dTDP-4-dehydrorhamnose 3,5-epimerase
MRVEPTSIPGVVTIHPIVRGDERGSFVKTFQRTQFAALGLETMFDEHFFSVSRKGVIRGMHFQEPPAAHAKVVFCVAGSVLDVVVDLRTSSPTYQQHTSIELDDEQWTMLHVPIGCAHGFATLSDHATMAYLTTTEHSPSVDAGIRWDSFGFDWPGGNPIVSERDRGLPTMQSYRSPFA